MKKTVFILAVLINFISCQKTIIDDEEIIPTHVLTKEDQDKLTPDKVIEELKQGNKDFVDDNLTIRNTTQRVREAALGQYPEAVVLSCLDSRVPVEDVFHKAIGEIFVARVAGNIVNDDIIGSLEFACKVSGSKVIMVLGHEYCGAINSSIDGVKLGHITSVLEKIEPAIEVAKSHYHGEATSKNPEFVDKVCEFNVLNSIKVILDQSTILKEMQDQGQIKIIGGVYNMKTGEVNFIE